MTGEPTDVPDIAFAAALAGLPSMTVWRLGALLRGRPARSAWRMAAGLEDPSPHVARLLAHTGEAALVARECRGVSVAGVWQRCLDLGVWVMRAGDPGFPPALAGDPVPPPVLFGLGDIDVLRQRRAAVVGTRSATAAGRSFAARLGFELADAGVAVVSGLARGIDGAVHQGALSAHRAASPGRPVGVVACGLDVVYPREHRALYTAVAEAGLLLSEVPPGTQPRPFRFPQRNRIVAALGEVVVVVESRFKGGSLITVEEANRRGVPVMAVPGAVCNPAAGGVNGLLRDGALIVTEPDDVLAVLSIHHHRAAMDAPAPTAHASLYQACLGAPRTIEQLVLDTGLSLAEVAVAARALVVGGWLTDDGGWYEARLASSLGAR